jgi:uncharacterized ubiquitin-like protein YukD
MNDSKTEMEGERDIIVISKAHLFSKEIKVSDACVTSCDFIKASS